MTDDKDNKTILICGPACVDPAQWGIPYAVYGSDINKHPDAAVWITSSTLANTDTKARTFIFDDSPDPSLWPDGTKFLPKPQGDRAIIRSSKLVRMLTVLKLHYDRLVIAGFSEWDAVSAYVLKHFKFSDVAPENSLSKVPRYSPPKKVVTQ